MIQCPYCDRTLSNDGSYRVHKHRFHKGLEYGQPVAVTHEEAQQTAPEPIGTEPEPIIHETPEPQPEQPEPKEPERRNRSSVERGNGGDGGLAIIGGLGAIAVVIILAMLGKKQ